jgi:hypothetical protein
MEAILGIIIFVVIISILNSIYNSFTSSSSSKTEFHQEGAESSSDRRSSSRARYSKIEESGSVKNLFQGYTISEDGDRVFIDKINASGEMETIEIINCWIESIELENDGDYINLRVVHRGVTYKTVGVPVDESYEIINKLGSYFQSKVIWEFKKLKSLYNDYLKNKMAKADQNLSANMKEIVSQTLKEQHEKVLRIFKEYKGLVGVYVEEDLSASVSEIEMNLELIDKIFSKNSYVSKS